MGLAIIGGRCVSRARACVDGDETEWTGGLEWDWESGGLSGFVSGSDGTKRGGGGQGKESMMRVDARTVDGR